ncbi:MAG: hypothetical protein KJP05_02570, partial [Deltaproteobacteria bacterium]|nr:hypothetical protein [Deltaproteobacteria bacterium]
HITRIVHQTFAAWLRSHPCLTASTSLKTRTFHESHAATADIGVLPGVLGCRTLRRAVQVRLRSNPAVPRDGCPVALPSSRSHDCN